MIAPRLSVVIVNFNSGNETRECLRAVAADLASVEWQAIVIDNASTDGSAARIEQRPNVNVIVNAENRGFGAAINQAAHTTAAPLLWLLNPDCRVEPGAFVALLETLDRHPGCAIAAPQLLNADGSVQASARGEPTAWTGLFGRHGLLAKMFPRSSMTRRNLQSRDLVASGAESMPVDWVMGASMLIRREMFDAVGGFDERYFLYWEDADLCHRLRERGWSTRFVPRARVVHSGGASARTRSRLAIRAFHESAYRYYATHVVRSAWHPARWLAKAALALRAQWRIWRG
jgi:N-acetylglucosaminyl-diphospho-decaprenol L-rhamnosyltransferase